MEKKRYNVDILSVSSIEKLKRGLLNYKDNILQQRVDLLAMRLAEKGVDIAQINVAELDAVFTGELISSIHTQYGGGTKGTAIFYVVADSEHAIYVEIGTGLIGSRSPYPGKLPVMYAQGKTIHKTENGKYGWFYQDDNGNWFFTEGMPSRPFMYETAMDLHQIVEKTAKEVFG